MLSFTFCRAHRFSAKTKKKIETRDENMCKFSGERRRSRSPELGIKVEVAHTVPARPDSEPEHAHIVPARRGSEVRHAVAIQVS